MVSAIALYAEFLLNIRQVTLYATLKNKQGEEVKAHIFSDRKSITVTHDGDSGRIIYPSGISGTAEVHIPLTTANVISLRFDIVEDGPSRNDRLEVANDSPWPAHCLGPETSIACRQCRKIVVHPKQRTWQDLPRSDWADMMDFWHCHRPPLEDAATICRSDYHIGPPVLGDGVGLVDIGHIELLERECVSVAVSA
jgi:hypothetical protein